MEIKGTNTKQKSIYQKEIMKGQIETDKKKPYDEGTKRKKKSYIEKKQGYQKEIMKGQIETNTKNWLDEKTYYGTN